MSDFMQGVKFVKYNCTAEYSTGPFSCLQGCFVLDRQVGYYILWAFLPSGTVSRNFLSDEIRLQLKNNFGTERQAMCVLISWMGFWIKLTVAPARVALGITTFLAVKVRARYLSDSEILSNSGVQSLDYTLSILL